MSHAESLVEARLSRLIEAQKTKPTTRQLYVNLPGLNNATTLILSTELHCPVIHAALRKSGLGIGKNLMGLRRLRVRFMLGASPPWLQGREDKNVEKGLKTLTRRSRPWLTGDCQAVCCQVRDRIAERRRRRRRQQAGHEPHLSRYCAPPVTQLVPVPQLRKTKTA